MAIALEFIDFIVPRSVIEEKYPGGWSGCLKDHRSQLGGRVWYDDHLFRDGAMNPQDIEILVRRWEQLGFETQEVIDGDAFWRDVCVVEAAFGGPTLPCSWIEVDSVARTTNLAGTPPGKVVFRDYSA